MIPGKPFNPATVTSRRPTPERFAHLKRWVEPIVRDIKITNITEMTNINEQLEQSADLYVSNVINRVIAQIIGAYGDGFVTIKSTAGGALHVADQGAGRTVLKAKIDFSTAITSEVVAAVTGKAIKIANIMLTVGGETNLTFKSATTAMSGALDFGGTNEPRGMVHHFGDCPLATAEGAAFQITSSIAVQVSGYVTYFTE